MAVEKIEVGEVADDKKGWPLRDICVSLNLSLAEIVLWITGGAKEFGDLNNALPIERGGTGATTAASARKALGIVRGSNYELAFANNCLELYDDRVTNYGLTDTVHGFTKVATGHYRLAAIVAGYGTGVKYIVPKDDIGNPLCYITISFESTLDTADILVYGVGVDGSGNRISNGVLQDIPLNRFIMLNIY